MSLSNERVPLGGIEAHSIDFIPQNERRGRVSDLFSFWFAQNMQVLTILTGSLAVILGLNLFWAIVAILLGNLIGTIFAAYHSAQGPILGVPQMIQTRAQFGFYGAFIFFFLTFFLQFGFFAGSVTLGAQALELLTGAISLPLGIILLAIPCTLIAVWGYHHIHTWQKGAAVVLAVVFTLVTIQALMRGGLPASALDATPPNWAAFLAVTAIMAIYAISWAPFVADYSRYLPKSTGVGPTFWYTYAGIALACVWLETIGSFITLQFADAGSVVAALNALSGSWILIILALSLVGAATTNLYGGMLALISMLNTWRTIEPSRQLRIVGVGITVVVGVAVAILGAGDFIRTFENFLLTLLFVFVPWTAINLTDFYLVRRGRYDVASLFTPSGIYGAWHAKGIIAYVVGLLVSLPFLSSTLWVGPFAQYLGGADVSWIVGLIVPAVLYWLLMRSEAASASAELEPASL